MTCCDNPNVLSSACADVCENCGWYQSYRGDCDEGYDTDFIDTSDDDDS